MNLFNQKIQADIYRIDPDKIIDTPIETIKNIIESHRGQSYISIELKKSISNFLDYNISLYINEINETIPDWLPFLGELISENEIHKLENLKRKYPSFLLFIYDIKNIFIVSKGAGRFVFSNFLQENFGIEILERLIDETETDIRSITERGVIGNILSSKKYYKPDHKFNDEQSFGKFYKSIETLISKEKLKTKLGIETDRTSLIISGENSLKISTKLGINDIVERVNKINLLLNESKTVHLNKFKKLAKKDLKKVLSTSSDNLQNLLEGKLIEEAYDEFKKGNYVEIYHPNILKYLEANSINFQFEDNLKSIDWSNRINLNTVFNLFNLEIKDIAHFVEFLNSVKTSLIFEDENEFNFKVLLKEWLIGDITFNEKMYFKFDGEWYIYENDFIKEIEDRIDSLLEKIGIQEDLENWKIGVSEGEYNQSFKNKNTLICDKALYGGIEICDFLKFDNNEIKLYHVKDKWGQSIRVVYNQIINGARFLAEIQNSDFKKINIKLKNYYNMILNTHYIHDKCPLTFDKFKKIIRSKKVKFILVYGSDSNKSRDEQIKTSKSNIAKLSIIQCENELRSLYNYNFDIIKVERK
jgi:uncharacterized protein (TIGR04141 family)